MKKSLFSLIAALGLLATSHTATAQTPVPAAVGVRKPAEPARIRQGVASGQLTRAEATRLRARQAANQQQKQAARADGVVSRDERQDIRQDDRRTSAAIYRQKHDAQLRRRAR